MLTISQGLKNKLSPRHLAARKARAEPAGRFNQGWTTVIDRFDSRMVPFQLGKTFILML